MSRPIKKVERNYASPSEVLNRYPDLHHKLSWTANDLGNLLRLNILKGMITKGNQSNYIDLDSIKPLIDVVNKNLDAKKIEL